MFRARGRGPRKKKGPALGAEPSQQSRSAAYECLRWAVAGAGVEAPPEHAPHEPNVPPSMVLADFQHCPFCFMIPPPECSAEAGTVAMSATTAAAARVKRMIASPWIVSGTSPAPVEGRYKSPIRNLYHSYLGLQGQAWSHPANGCAVRQRAVPR